MTGANLLAFIRRRTRTDSNTYSDADVLVDVNIHKDQLASRIQQIRPEIFQIPTLDDLVADQREYAFPADVMNNLVNLELKFDSSGDYKLATSADRFQFRKALQESIIIENFTNEDPKYFIRRQAFYILSGAIIAVTDGIRVVYNAFPADLSNLTGSTGLEVDPSTTTHGFPKEFHEFWARAVSIEYKDQNNMSLSTKEKSFDADLLKAIDDFSIPVLDHQIVGGLPDRATDGTDNGFLL